MKLIMGIQNYLRRVSSATKDIKSAIEEKGVPVSQCEGLEALADKVRAIQTGSGPISIEDQMFVMLAFRQSSTAPAVPTGGYFSETNITYPTGWSDGSGLTENIWMSYCIIKGDGTFYKDWVSPIKISSGSSEIDLTDYALKSWVTNEIAKAITGGTLDLSNYYTKAEVDAKITTSVAGVSSVNDLTGAVTLQGSSTVNISKSGNTLTFTSTGGTTPGGDAYIACNLYTISNSRTMAPEIPAADTTWDSETKSLINTPAGWGKQVVVTTAEPYVWQITGTFNTVTGAQVGTWDGPICISGNQGDPGPKGEDGDIIEEIYAVYNSVAVMPTIDASVTDANGKTATDDGYLPNFMFGTTAVAASIELLSVDSTNRYLFKSKRRKHDGTWLSYSDPVIAGNWTETELSPEEIEQLKDNIKNDVKDSLTEANQRVDALQTRLNSIDYTDATFIKDPKNALIAAITQYKDANQKSFADLIIDGQEAEIKALAGAEVNGHLTEAGITIDGLGAKLKSFADFKDTATDDISTVSSKLDAINTTIKNSATKTELENVNSAIQEINGKNAEIISSVSKSTYVWVKKDSAGNVIADSTVAYDASQYLAEGAAYADKDKYEAAMKAQGYELDLSVHAFSQIKQAAGEVDITAGDGKAAQLKIYGDNDTSRIIMKAEQVDFSGNMNGKGLTVTDLTVTGTKGKIDPVTKLPQLGATIDSAYINECQINSCEIASQIKSKTYVNRDDSKSQEGKGFLIDAGAVEADGLEFAFYGQTSDGGKFELTNNSLVIPSAVIGDVSVDTIVSKEFSSATDSTAGNGFSLNGKTGTFELYGDKTEDGDVAFTLTNSKLEIPAAYIKNLTTGEITDFANGVWNTIGTDAIKLAENISSVIADQADFYVKTLSTKDSNYHHLYIGADTVTTNTNSVAYSNGYDSGEVHFDSTAYWERTIPVGNPISAKEGQILHIPSVRWQAWGWFAYTLNRSSNNESVKLFLVKKSGSSWSDVKELYTWGGMWKAKGTHDSHDTDGRYTGSTTYSVTSDGEYALQFRISLEHPGDNAKGWSKLRFSHSMYTLKTTSDVEGTTGITINPTTFVAKCSTANITDNVTEASLSIDSSGISSTGFVLSKTVTGIKTVDTANDCNDQNTLYIILK